MMNKIDWTNIANAVEVIKMGICNRCDLGDVIVYKCGDFYEIGGMVFLTKEEAQKELERRKKLK